jgi:hypothetical protein
MVSLAINVENFLGNFSTLFLEIIIEKILGCCLENQFN